MLSLQVRLLPVGLGRTKNVASACRGAISKRNAPRFFLGRRLDNRAACHFKTLVRAPCPSLSNDEGKEEEEEGSRITGELSCEDENRLPLMWRRFLCRMTCWKGLRRAKLSRSERKAERRSCAHGVGEVAELKAPSGLQKQQALRSA